MLGSNGESDGRSILGLCSGAALGCSGLTGRLGNGGPSRGWVPGEGLFFREGSLLGAMLSSVRELASEKDGRPCLDQMLSVGWMAGGGGGGGGSGLDDW